MKIHVDALHDVSSYDAGKYRWRLLALPLIWSRGCEAALQKMFCHVCGFGREKNANFCQNCGAEYHKPSTSSPTTSENTTSTQPLSFNYMKKKHADNPKAKGDNPESGSLADMSTFHCMKKRKKNERLNHIKKEKKDEMVKVRFIPELARVTNSARLFTPGETKALAESKVHQISRAWVTNDGWSSSLISKIWRTVRSGKGKDSKIYM